MHTHANAEEDRTPEIIPPITPSAPWRVREVEPRPQFRLWVRFNDGTEGDVDMAGLVRSSGAGVFAALRDEMLFRQVRLECGAVTWPGDLDLAPDAMYEAIKVHGEWVVE
ncbi:MAG: DUF2442 domain-containing protein [Gammaproteobacteria bacterium]|nr:DUF2442 domain-containing protein [Gammaproteobacteria bacterium]